MLAPGGGPGPPLNLSRGECLLSLDLTALDTFALSMLVLFVGAVAARRVRFLRRYNIPEPVIGGLVYAGVASVLFYAADFRIHLNTTLMNPMMLAFFAKIGLSANIKMLQTGGRKVIIFSLIALAFVVAQNLLGVGLATIMGLDSRIGLLAGSITMSGGHGTGVSWAQKFSDLPSGMEIAVACATFGLIIGGMLGGPIAQRLIAKFKLAPDDKVADADSALKDHGYDEPELVTPKTMLEMLFLVTACVLLGQLLHTWVKPMVPTLPEFVCVMFLGIVFRNVLEHSDVYNVPEQTSDLVGVLALSVFLSIAMMSMSLKDLIPLAGPLAILVLAQSVLTAIFTTYVTFRLMGRDYDAAVITSGHCGFGMGATPTAVANMEAMVMRYGDSPTAFLVVPLVGAFFIDVANLGVIQIFLLVLGHS